MTRLMARLFRARTACTPRKTPAPRARLAVESLEDRRLMAAHLGTYGLQIDGTNGNDTAYVNVSGSNYRVTFNGTDSYFAASDVASRGGWLDFYGFDGNDTFVNNCAALRCWAQGGNGNDFLYGDGNSDNLWGDAGNDTLKGYGGDDYLYGGADNDKLYGQSGYDRLYGEDGNDWLDDGSGTESNDGGAGRNFNAYLTTVGGATYTDVYQGGGGGTCWIVASIQSATYAGWNLASRITYAGNDTYQVFLYNVSGTYVQQSVSFSGDVNGVDAQPNPNQVAAGGFSESWVTITQRAFLLSRSLSVTSDPGSGNVANANRTFLGWEGNYYQPTTPPGYLFPTYTAVDQTRIRNALATGRPVSALTPATLYWTSRLQGFHWYTVTGMDAAGNVTLRNPYGRDNAATPTGDANDGIVTVPWSEFARSIVEYNIA